MVKWDTISLPTDHGGLSIHAACPRNLSPSQARLENFSGIGKFQWEITLLGLKF